MCQGVYKKRMEAFKKISGIYLNDHIYIGSCIDYKDRQKSHGDFIWSY